MLFEWRTYHFAPGRALAYLEVFGREGLPHVTRHLPLMGYWLTECGRLNMLHHLWVYDDLDDRAACRARLAADPDWTAGFGPKAFPMIEAQETVFLAPTYSAPALEAALRTARRPHAALGPGEAVLRPSWGILEITEGAPSETDTPDPVALWRVVAGERPGTVFALRQSATSPDLLRPMDPALRRELMRPCAFSPL